MLALLMSVSALALTHRVPATVMIGDELYTYSLTLAPHYRGADLIPYYDYEAVCKLATQPQPRSKIPGGGGGAGVGIPGTGIAGGGIVPPGGLLHSEEELYQRLSPEKKATSDAARASSAKQAAEKCTQKEQAAYLLLLETKRPVSDYCVIESVNTHTNARPATTS